LRRKGRPFSNISLYLVKRDGPKADKYGFIYWEKTIGDDTIPAKKKFTLGLPTDFEPVWEQFLKNLKGSKKSDLIRRLIFGYVNGDIVDTDGSGSLLTEDEWYEVRNAFKAYKKYADGKIGLNQSYNGFYITPWNEYYNPVFTKEEVDDYCKNEGYEIIDNLNFPMEDDAYNLKKIPNFKQPLNTNDLEKRHQKTANTLTVDVIVKRFKSKPNTLLVVSEWKEDSFRVITDYYERFKKKNSQTVYDLIALNQKIVLSWQFLGLFNWAPDLMNIPIEDNRKDYFERFKVAAAEIKEFGKLGSRDFPDIEQHPSRDHLVEKFGDVINESWKDAPQEIVDFLVLKPYHLTSKKNLRDFKRDNRKIKNVLSKAIEFDASEGNRIRHVPAAGSGPGFDRVVDVTNSETNRNQIIEED